MKRHHRRQNTIMIVPMDCCVCMQIRAFSEIRSVKYYILLLSSVYKRAVLICVIFRIQIVSYTCKEAFSSSRI